MKKVILAKITKVEIFVNDNTESSIDQYFLIFNHQTVVSISFEAVEKLILIAHSLGILGNREVKEGYAVTEWVFKG